MNFLRAPGRWHALPLLALFVLLPGVPAAVADGLPAWPVQWTVFGLIPAKDAAVVPDEAVLASVPAELVIAGRTYAARKAEARDGLLDLEELFQAGAEERLGVWVFAKIESPAATELDAGAGADWFMDWYVNGKRVFDTLAKGNGRGDFSPSNHPFRVALRQGTNVLAVHVLSGSAGFQLVSGIPQESPKALTTPPVTAQPKVSASGQAVAGAFPAAPPTVVGPHDWPQFGGTGQRNLVSAETDLPDAFEIGDGNTPATNIRWVAKFGGNYVGANNAAVAGGKVFMGLKMAFGITPEEKKRNYLPFTCLDEKTGAMLWQLNSQQSTHTTKSKSTIGNLSVPTVDGNRVYLYRRNLIVCLTANGFTGTNQGPFTDEDKEYGLDSADKLTARDADIVWMFNLYDELGVKIDHSVVYAPLVYGRYVYVSTGNSFTGGDDGRAKLKTADLPCFIAIDKETGKLAAAENEGIGKRNIRGQWGSPSVAMVNGKAQILFGGGDGTVYAFEPLGDQPPADGKLKKLWSFDLNKDWIGWKRNLRPGGEAFDLEKIQKATGFNHFVNYRRNRGNPAEGQQFPLGAPVGVNNRVFVALGGDWGSGTEASPYWPAGRLVCIDASKEGDVTATGLVWENTEIGLTEATVSVADNLVYLTDMYGKVHCLDAQTGKTYWTFAGGAPFYSSTMVADGKVYVGNSKGEFFIFKAGRELQLLHRTSLKGWISGAMAVANRTLYVVAGNNLYAISK